MGPARPELEEELETDYASHYPGRRQSPPLGSYGERYVLSGGGRGRRDPLPTTVSEMGAGLALRDDWMPLEGHGGTGGTTPVAEARLA